MQRHFDIPAGPAAQTVHAFMEQAGLSVIYEEGRLNGFKTRAVRGDYAPIDALRKLLSGTGLSFKETTSNFISIHSAPAEGPKVSPPASPPLGLPLIEISTPGRRDAIDLPPNVRIMTITAQELSQRGFSSIADWARSLTQNQGTGAYEGTSYQREALANIAYGSGLNLYGLGQRATLVLVNGRRLAPGGSAGSFTDVLNIPIAAIDYIELISDGASTIYGADAIGGIVNFVLRDSGSRSETRASFGHVTRSDLAGSDFSQSYAKAGGLWQGVVAVEYYNRSGLPASQRSQATSNVTPWGGSNFNIAFGNPPSVIDSTGHSWGIAAGQDGRSLTAAQLLTSPNLYDRHADTWVLPRQERFSALADIAYAASSSTSISVQSLLTRRQIKTYDAPVAVVLSVPSSNPSYVNPVVGSTTPLEVLYGFGKDLGPIIERGTVNSGQLALGVEHKFSDRWRLKATGGYTFDNQHESEDNLVDFDELTTYLASSDPAVAFNPFGGSSSTNPATLAAIRTQGGLEYRSAFKTYNVEASGSIPLQPTRSMAVTMGFEHRIQTFKSTVSRDFNFAAEAMNMDVQRTLNAAYMQTAVPVLSSVNLSGGLRYEHFSDAGSAFMPSFGLAFDLNSGLSLTGTWARMFRPPNLPDLNESANYAAVYPLADRSSSLGYTKALVWGGNNAQLSPETAHSWMLGLKFNSVWPPGLLVDLQYYNITSSHQVSQSQLLPTNLFSDPQYSYLFRRNVSEADLTNICSHGTFYGSPEQCRASDIGAIVDLRLRSAQTVKTDGLDLRSQYSLQAGPGLLKLDLEATYVLHFTRELAQDGGWVSYRNTPHNPIAVKLRGACGWDTPRFFVSPAVNFQGSYSDNISVPHRHVSSWTTWDLAMGYKLVDLDEMTGGETTIAVRGFNVFNKQPPFLNNDVGAIGYDPENADLLGRRVSLSLQHEW